MKLENTKNQWGSHGQHERTAVSACQWHDTNFWESVILIIFELKNVTRVWRIRDFERSLTFLLYGSHAVSLGWCIFKLIWEWFFRSSCSWGILCMVQNMLYWFVYCFINYEAFLPEFWKFPLYYLNCLRLYRFLPLMLLVEIFQYVQFRQLFLFAFFFFFLNNEKYIC